MIRLSPPALGEEEALAVQRVLASGRLAQGALVARFEEEFARLIGAREAVAVSSGTAALTLTLRARGIGAGDEVITTPFTFAATANAVLLAGARPVFVDVREDDFNIDVSLIEARLSGRTKALLPVHLFGQPADMTPIMEIARAHGLLVIEDAAQAVGALFAGRPAGGFSDGCYSFYATKNLTTGEGGMVTTDDTALADRLRLLRNHGERTRYVSEELGENQRLTEIAAAIGLAQFEKLAGLTEARRANAAYLSERLRGVVPPAELPGRRHVYHRYTVRVPAGRRDALAGRLRDAGIETGVYYPLPLHKQPLYRRLGYDDRLPVAERLPEEVLALPVHPGLSPADLERIVAVVNGAPPAQSATKAQAAR